MVSDAMRFDTLAIHAGQEPDPTTGAIMTPVYLTSTYVQAGPGEHKGYEYSRTKNPTRTALEGCLAALEGARFGYAFASGLAATDGLMHLLDAGDHVVCSDDVYGGTFRIFDKVFKRLGLTFSFVDLSKPGTLEAAITPKTRMVHPKAGHVVYPGLPSHPQHGLARKQMKGFGGMLTFEIKGGLPAARKFLKAVKVFACAESLGGVESLIEHPAIMTHASVPPETRAALGISDGFIRLSVGIEDVQDLVDDLTQAFTQA